MSALAVDLTEPDAALVAGVRHVVQAGATSDRGDWGVVRDVVAWLRVQGAEPSEFALARAEREAVIVRGEMKQARIQAAAEEPNLGVEQRRQALGFPENALRCIDFRRGQTYSPPTWLVKGVLPGSGLGLLYGESQAGKSFLALHAALCVAWGIPFFGKRAKPGGVLYVAAEGGSGVLPRLEAAENALRGAVAAAGVTGRRQAGDSAPLRVAIEAPNLSREGDPAKLLNTIRKADAAFKDAGSRLALVVIDTWHAALGGADEQSAADAGHALKPLKEAVEELGVFGLLVHHPGKDIERGARGSSALPAAVDTVIELRVPGCDGPKAKPADMLRRASITKQRDGAVDGDFHFRLATTVIGTDEDGEPWTTCTVEPCDAPILDEAGRPQGKGGSRLMKAVEVALAECGQGRAELRAVRGYFNNAGKPEETADAKRQAWGRAFKQARDAGLVETDSLDQFIWIPSPKELGSEA